MDIIVYDEFGIKVIYEEAMNDMLEIEEELLKAGTYYINQHEFVSNNETKEPSNAIDRSEMTMQLIDKEF